MTTLNNQRKNFDSDKIYVLERSLESSRNVFQKNLQMSGLLDPIEDYILSQLYQTFISSSPSIKGVISMKTPLATTLHRLIRRAKEADKSLDENYVTNIHELNNKYIDSLTVPVLSVTPEMIEMNTPLDIFAEWRKNLC